MAARKIWQKAFLTSFREIGIVTTAAKNANVNPRTVHKARKTDPDFAEQFLEALEEAADLLEAEARRRGAEGFEEPMFFQGRQVGVVKKYSDNLLMFMLKGMRPEKFREKVTVPQHELEKLIEQELKAMSGQNDDEELATEVPS